MGKGWRALRLAALDLWEESLTLILLGLVGGILAVLLLPLPFVLAAHYGVAARIPEHRGVGWREWLRCGREHASFFYRWMLLVLLGSLVLLSSGLLYLRIDASWATALSGLMGGLLLLWWLPQPYVPALYLQQEDQRLRVALRNAAILVANDPLAALLLWGSSLLLGFMLSYIAVPLLALLGVWAALFSTRVVWLRLNRSDDV